MGKAYTQVSNDARRELIRLIYEDNLSIVKAAEATGIYYPTAKAINKVYKRENRVQKRCFRYRTKKEDEAAGVVRNKIPIEKLAAREGNLSMEDRLRITCGVKPIKRKQAQVVMRRPKDSTLGSILVNNNTAATPLNKYVVCLEKPTSNEDSLKLGGAETT